MAAGSKTGGRKAGTPNKTTAELREMLSRVLGEEIQRIPEYFEKLEPDQRLHALTRLLPYILPKKQETPEDKPDEVIHITMNLGDRIEEVTHVRSGGT